MKLISGTVLVRISAKDKAKRLQFDAGTKILTAAIEAGEDQAEFYNQTVGAAEVIAVADDVRHIKVGDIAILDYVAEGLTDRIVYADERGKILSLEVFTVYHEDDKYVYNSGLTRNVMTVWEKGDVDTASVIYGVFRDNKLIPNPPYIFCEHKDFCISAKTKSGITHTPMEEGARIRRVLVPNIDSEPEVLPGTLVVVEDFCLYEREMDGKTFDVIMDQDIELSFE